MTVKAQLMVTFSLITILMTVPAIYGVTQLADLRDIASDLSGGHAEAINTVGRIQTELVRFERSASRYVSFGAPEHRSGMEEALASVREGWAQLEEYHDPSMKGDWLDQLDRASGALGQLVADSAFTAATAMLAAGVRPLLNSAEEPLGSVARAIDEEGAAGVAQAQRISSAATRTALLGMGIALVLALVIAGWMTRALISPLRRLRDGMASVADGHFAPPAELPYGQKNEIGDLSRSFRAMAWRLAELDRLKSEFVSVIGHDLKTPLNIITGYSDLVEEGSYGDMSEDQKDMLEAILDQSRLLTGLANQLLNLSKFEAGGFRIEPEEVEIAHFLSVIRRSFIPLAARQSINFSIDVDPSTPETILADAECLQNEVLGNLLTNAFKFTPGGGRVVLSLTREPRGVRITVSDTGIGISEDHLPFIFEKYYRVGKDARGDGSGLGLAIARDVVAAHGGTIEATSDPEGGTSISFLLPIYPAVGSGEGEDAVMGEVVGAG